MATKSFNQTLIANGNANGTLTIADSSGFEVGATVFLAAKNERIQQLKVSSKPNSTSVVVTTMADAEFDASAFTVAKEARLFQPKASLLIPSNPPAQPFYSGTVTQTTTIAVPNGGTELILNGDTGNALIIKKNNVQKAAIDVDGKFNTDGRMTIVNGITQTGGGYPNWFDGTSYFRSFLANDNATLKLSGTVSSSALTGVRMMATPMNDNVAFINDPNAKIASFGTSDSSPGTGAYNEKAYINCAGDFRTYGSFIIDGVVKQMNSGSPSWFSGATYFRNWIMNDVGTVSLSGVVGPSYGYPLGTFGKNSLAKVGVRISCIPEADNTEHLNATGTRIVTFGTQSEISNGGGTYTEKAYINNDGAIFGDSFVGRFFQAPNGGTAFIYGNPISICNTGSVVAGHTPSTYIVQFVDGQTTKAYIDRSGYLSAAGVVLGGGTPISKSQSATKTWNPGTLADGAVASTTVTLVGAALGDIANAAYAGIGDKDVLISANVQAADTVRVVIMNKSGDSITFPDATLRVNILKYS